MTTRVLELYGKPTGTRTTRKWGQLVKRQACPFLHRKCLKIRKSEPQVSIGTCTVTYGRDNKNIVICPFRLLERNQVFVDCRHLLTVHEPGNELHIVPEVSVPGGSVDYCLASVRNGRVEDFVGVEFQTIDTTGTVWPERQRFLREKGISVRESDASSKKGFGMNWKMTAKTILVQLHHKIETFESIHKHLVLVAQDYLIEYMRREFSFEHLREARLGDSMHLHTYSLGTFRGSPRIELAGRASTDADGISQCLGLQSSPNMELQEITRMLEAKISPQTLLTIGK